MVMRVDAEEEKRVIAIAACSDDGCCDDVDIKAIQEQVEAALKGRENSVMTRLNNETLEKLDALVEIELFRSRSEAAAYFITEGINSKSELFNKIMPTLSKIQRLKDELKKELE